MPARPAGLIGETMNDIERKRSHIENRIINLCASRHLKNGIMKDIDILCSMMVQAALHAALHDAQTDKPKYREPRYDDVYFDGLDALNRM